VQFAAPELENEPAAQGEQAADEVALEALENEPAAQLEHAEIEVAPTCEEKVPRSHGVQPAALVVPGLVTVPK